jgi:hypothetical protein
MRARNALWMVVGLGLGVPACALHDGGLSPAALSTPDDEDGGAPADDAPTATGGSGGATGGSAAAGGTGGTGVGAGGQGGAAPADAGPLGTTDATVHDAHAEAPAVTAGTITCGTSRCNADNEICCVGATGAGTCSKSSCAATAATRRCDGPEDCDGERICCAQDALVGGYRTACVKPSECANAGGVPLCRGNADCFDGYKACAPTDFSGWEVSTCHR